MTSRLWRPPALRVAEHEAHGSAVSWTELFSDLVFVVAVANLGHRFIGAPSLVACLEFVAVFGMLWWAWASVTFLVDRYESDDALHRLLAVLQMAGVDGIAVAVGSDRAFEAISAAIAASYLCTRIALVAMYGRVWWHVPDSRALVRGYLRGFAADAALWAASIAVAPPARYVLWAIAMAVSLATPWLMRRTQARSPLSVSHLPERFGLFTILVLGESVTALVAGLRVAGLAAVGGAACGGVVATGLWWIYFENFEGSVVRRDPSRVHDWRPTTWIYAHFPLAVCLTIAGDAMEHLVDGGEPAATRVAAIECGAGLAGTLLAMALILASTAGGDHASRSRRAAARGVGAAAAVIAAVSSAGMPPALFLATLGAIVAAEGLFDVADRVMSRADAIEVAS